MWWFLTADDGGADGELRKYLSQPKRWRNYDSELFQKLQRILDEDVRRSVSHAQAWGLVPGAVYFEEILRDSRSSRSAYFEAAQQALRNCDLIFVDPDNGIEIPSTKLGASGSSKYVYWSELQTIYAAGHSILVYQHFPRVVRERFIPFLANRLTEELPGSAVTAFATPYAVFFLAQQPKHAEALDRATQAVQQQWRGQIETWPAGATKPA